MIQNNSVKGQTRACDENSVFSKFHMESKKAILGVFCCLNVLIYLDRGTISSNGVNGDGLQREFELSLFRDGILPAGFMVGLLISSPIFAHASKTCHSMKLIGYGLSIWFVSVLGCAVSFGFWSLLVCRMVVGVGEASFVALAAPFIDDYAPKDHKTRWLAVFYACIPVGYALGFLYGGLVGSFVGWRAAFAMEAVMMLPFIWYCFRTDISLQRKESTDLFDHRAGFVGDLVHVFQYNIFVLTTIGMTCYTAIIGSYAFYGPQAATSVFDVSSEKADVSFSIMTVLTGILGTFLGGHVLDSIGSSLRHGMVLGACGMCGGAVCIAVAFIMSRSFIVFCIVFGLGEFLLFFTQAPSNALILWSVPPPLRSLAVSMSVVSMHLLGDVPGPPIMGLVQSSIGDWRITMALATLVIALGAVAYAVGVHVAPHATDFREAGLSMSDGSLEEYDHDEEESLLVVG